MVLLAVLVGVGVKGISALSDSADPTATGTTGASINAPALPTATTETQQPAPTLPAEIANSQPTQQADTLPNAPERGETPTPETDETPEPSTADDGLDVTARAVYAYNPEVDKPLYQTNATERMGIGSIVKVATALVTVANVDLDEQVLIDESDLVDPGIYSNMGLLAGDTLTVEQLLQGLLVPSGGDAAMALARYVGMQLSGSDDPDTARAAFVEQMNLLAEQLGLSNTNFTNPSGDDDKNNYSTAEDVAKLGAALMESKALVMIVAMPNYEFTSIDGNAYAGVNTNQLLGVSGVVGIKTGSTGDAGGCVVLAQVREDGTMIILTILGSDLAYDDLNRITTDMRWDDAQQVLNQLASGS
jgi:D-alanyl-D-alanine carboxypeptidase (penicillin-binding protein 5/6)